MTIAARLEGVDTKTTMDAFAPEIDAIITDVDIAYAYAFAETVTPTGSVVLQHRNAGGTLLAEITATNMVVTAGKVLIADRMLATPSKAAVGYLAVGKSDTATAVTQTALSNETARTANAFTAAAAAGVLTYTATLPAGVGTGKIREVGLFNASSGGDMLCRTTFAVIQKAQTDTLSITWSITVA